MGEEQLREMRSSYYGLITECDENLGRVFEALERSGQRDNTVVVFTTVLIPQPLSMPRPPQRLASFPWDG